jgi:hypothetical protein
VQAADFGGDGRDVDRPGCVHGDQRADQRQPDGPLHPRPEPAGSERPRACSGPSAPGRAAPHPQADVTRRNAASMVAPAKGGLTRPPCPASSRRSRSQ